MLCFCHQILCVMHSTHNWKLGSEDLRTTQLCHQEKMETWILRRIPAESHFPPASPLLNKALLSAITGSIFFLHLKHTIAQVASLHCKRWSSADHPALPVLTQKPCAPSFLPDASPTALQQVPRSFQIFPLCSMSSRRKEKVGGS